MTGLEKEVERQLDVMRDGAVDFFGEEDLRPRLASALRESRPLRVKLGLDPSSPHIHLGHSVVLMKLRRFQDLGHMPIFLVGDFTARIGDPSGKKKTRPALGAEEIQSNAATYVEQAGLLLDVERAEIRFNSEWMDDLAAADFVRLCSHYTVARLLERDDFAKRYSAGEPIAVHEFLYPFAQAYDSVALELADVELGGTDQTFNLLMASEIQRDYGQPPQAVLTHPLLVGTDGVEKMSKSLGNAIGVTEPPEDMYGKLMSISDALMLEYHDRLGSDEWSDLGLARERLAEGEGRRARVQAGPGASHRRALPGSRGCRSAVPSTSAGWYSARRSPRRFPSTASRSARRGRSGLLELLERLGFTRSRGEARRLVNQRAVQVDGLPVEDPTLRLTAGSYLIRGGEAPLRAGRAPLNPPRGK